MQAWSGQDGDETVSGNESPKLTTPPLKNYKDLVESGTTVGSRTSRFIKHKEKMKLIILISLLFLLLVFAAIMTILYALQKHHKPVRICESKECLRSAANLALSMDLTADPCEYFYQYTCGNWAKGHPQPDIYHSYDWIHAKTVNVDAQVRDFLTKNRSTDSPRAVNAAKDLYAACMDTDTLEKQGLKPIFSVLKSLGLPPFPTFINATEVDYSSYTFDWLETVIKIRTQIGMDVIIGFSILPLNRTLTLVMGSPDSTNTNPFESFQYKQNGLAHGSKGIHMPRRKRNLNIIQEFAKMMSDDTDNEKIDIYNFIYAKLMKIFISESEKNKDMKLTETELDENIKTTKDAYVLTNKVITELEKDNSTDSDYKNDLILPQFTVDDLQNLTDVYMHNNVTARPIWKRYLEGIFNVSDVNLDFENDKILVMKPDLVYLAKIAAFMAQTPPVIIELYLWIKVVAITPDDTKLLSILEKALKIKISNYYAGSRSLQCANTVNQMLGMAVAYGLVDPHFSNVTKPKVEIMLNEVKNSLTHFVGQAKWMDEETKLATYQKIIQMKSLIGFPDWLLEEGKLDEYYSGIEVQPGKYLENLFNIIQAGFINDLNKFHAVLNTTWTIDPTEVNANYNFLLNTITVPLVFLQYPFFNLGIDSLNYGSLGTVLGHEITHGLIISVDGEKTLGENIADNGGVREALAALRNHLRKTGPEMKLPGLEKFTSDQMFFLSFGNLLCGVSSTESLKSDLEDEHAPQQFRVTGSLQNMETFAKTWKCKPGSFMNPEKKCIIY